MTVKRSSPESSLSKDWKKLRNLLLLSVAALSPRAKGLACLMLSLTLRIIPSIVVKTLPSVPASSTSSIWFCMCMRRIISEPRHAIYSGPCCPKAKVSAAYLRDVNERRVGFQYIARKVFSIGDVEYGFPSLLRDLTPWLHFVTFVSTLITRESHQDDLFEERDHLYLHAALPRRPTRWAVFSQNHYFLLSYFIAFSSTIFLVLVCGALLRLFCIHGLAFNIIWMGLKS
mmetsp:Transcript_10156/g.14674  ORF Transcript_10156/g.14674 Transcript_10156/m.14674 type:complete len:229 (-) Transcript_10156:934-1620(-)